MPPGNSFRKLLVKIRKGNIPWYFKDKYILTSFAFLIWMIFFDRNNVSEQINLHRALNDLRSKSEYYAEQIEIVNKERSELFTSMASLEKFAREQYMMKKKEEDLYLILPETNANKQE